MNFCLNLSHEAATVYRRNEKKQGGKLKQQKLAKKYTKLLDSSEKQQKRLFSKSMLDSLRSNDKNRFNVGGAGYELALLDDASKSGFNDESNYDESYDDDDDDDDVGSIHPYGPDIDPTQLLHSLTEQDETKILAFNSNSIPLSRKPNSETKGGPLAPLPGAPREIDAQIIKPRSVTLSWKEPYKNADEITSYSVFYKLSTSERQV